MANGSDDVFDDASGQLHRKQIAGGGEVVTGALVSEALEAVGARAMTLDHTIFVDESFDPNSAEDQALYAHERLHQLGSGGEHSHGGHEDAEEAAAKAVERMVLHRRARGEDFGSILRDVDAGHIDDPAEGGGAEAAPTTEPDDPMSAYRSLRKAGWTHESVVRMLARHVVQAVLESQGEKEVRAPSGEKTF